jgi:hypothetical protein
LSIPWLVVWPQVIIIYLEPMSSCVKPLLRPKIKTKASTPHMFYSFFFGYHLSFHLCFLCQAKLHITFNTPFCMQHFNIFHISNRKIKNIPSSFTNKHKSLRRREKNERDKMRKLKLKIQG